MPDPKKINPADLGLPKRPVADLALLNDALDRARERGCNVLAPRCELLAIPRDHTVGIRAIQFDAEFRPEHYRKGKDGTVSRNFGSNGTFYLQDGKLCFHRAALDQLASAAGVSYRVQRVDDGSEWGLWEYKAVATFRNLDGEKLTREGSKVLDLRDGSADSAGMSDHQIKEARRNGPAVCESKAINRAIRRCIGLQGGYTAAEAAQPFVFPVLIYEVPDLPEARLLQAAVHLGVVEQLFGMFGRRVLPVIEGEAVEPRRLADNQAARDIEAMGREPDTDERAPVPREDPRQEHDGRRREASRDASREERREAPREEAPRPLRCDEKGCGREITEKVAGYSVERFGRPLCFPHQPRGA